MLSNGTYTRLNGGNPDLTKTWPQFFTDTVMDQAASAREGRQIWREEERVRIIMPGNQLTVPVFKVTDEHKEKWPDHYKAFKENREISVDGFAIEEWPILNKAMVAELKYLGFRTVEQIADAPDTAIQRIGMGGFSLRDRAKAFVDDATRMAQNEILAKENDRLNAEVASLKSQMDQLQESSNRMFQEMMTLKNAPSPIASMVPGMADPTSNFHTGVAEVPVHGGSSLDSLAMKPKRGRPAKAA